MLETIFDGGGRGATSEGARANYDANVANYRQTTFVISGSGRQSRRAPDTGARSWQQKDAVAEAERGDEIFTNRYQLVADPYLQVVSAETIALQNERNESS